MVRMRALLRANLDRQGTWLSATGVVDGRVPGSAEAWRGDMSQTRALRQPHLSEQAGQGRELSEAGDHRQARHGHEGPGGRVTGDTNRAAVTRSSNDSGLRGGGGAGPLDQVFTVRRRHISIRGAGTHPWY